MSISIVTKPFQVSFDGFIYDQNECHRLIIYKSDDQDKLPRIECDWHLHYRLKNHFEHIKKRLSAGIETEKLVSEIQVLLKSSTDDISKYQFDLTQIVLQQLEQLGFDKLVDIDEEFQKITLQASDEFERIHKLHIEIPPEFPSQPPNVHTILPRDFQFAWAANCTLEGLYSQFQNELKLYQEYWEDFDELVSNMWIIEPEKPNLSVTSFTIAIDDGCSILIKLDPFERSSAPDIRFIGSDQKISEIRSRFYENIDDWSDKSSTFQNLKSILQIDFPQPPSTSSSSKTSSQICFICRIFECQEEVPNQLCTSNTCQQTFHKSCLSTWFRISNQLDLQSLRCPTCDADVVQTD